MTATSLNTLTTSQLVKVYNAVTGASVKKFETRERGLGRTRFAIDQNGFTEQEALYRAGIVNLPATPKTRKRGKPVNEKLVEVGASSSEGIGRHLRECEAAAEAATAAAEDHREAMDAEHGSDADEATSPAGWRAPDVEDAVEKPWAIHLYRDRETEAFDQLRFESEPLVIRVFEDRPEVQRVFVQEDGMQGQWFERREGRIVPCGKLIEDDGKHRDRYGYVRSAPKPKAEKKAQRGSAVNDKLVQLMSRPDGATGQEMADALGWKSRPARAHKDAAKKAGREIVTFKREDGKTAYRLA